jgi:hypothetical protein
MPGFSARLIGFLTLAALASPALSAPIVVDGIALDLPADSTGWTSQTMNGGSLMLTRNFVDSDGDKSAAMVQIGTRITQGTFDANLAGMLKVIPELAEEDPTLKYDGTTPAGYRISMRDVCCGYRNDISMSQIVVGVQMPDQSQRFLLLLTMNMSSDDKKIVENDFAYLARSLRPEGTAEAPKLAPADGDGGLEGVYTTLRTGLSLNAFGGMDFNADSVILAFDKSGLFSHEIPSAGQTMAEHCAESPDECGTYRLDGGGLFGGPDKITLRDLNSDYAILENDEMGFGRDGDGLKLGDEDFRHIPPFSRDTKFNGSWRYFWAQTGSLAFSSNSVSVERVLQMDNAGRFTMQGWSGFSSSNTIGDSTVSTAGNSDGNVEAGRYEVDGYTLKLIGDDGKEVLMSLFAPDIGSDGILVLNGGNYLKQD